MSSSLLFPNYVARRTRSAPWCFNAMGLCLVVVMANACVANDFVPPVTPSPGAQPRGQTPSEVPGERSLRAVLSALEFTGDIDQADPNEMAEMKGRFADYLEAMTPFDAVEISDEPAGGERYRIEATIQIERRDFHTYVLDALSIPAYGLLTPWWGDLSGSVKLDVYDPAGTLLATVHHEEQVDFNQVLFSWYAKEFVEGAYTTLFAVLFRASCVGLRENWHALIHETPDSVPAFEISDRSELDQIQSWWNGTRLRVITDYEARSPPDRWAEKIARAAGGVEAQLFRGFANVSSGVTDESGNTTTIASGDAMQRGYRVSLYTPPRKTGVSVYPVVGFLSQSIEIEDFRENIADQANDDSAAREIGAVCRDVIAGINTDCDIPNTYGLEMESFYAGARVGADLVVGTDYFRQALSVQAGINALEYRGTRVEVGTFSARTNNFEAFQSFAIGAQWVVFLPKKHFGLRAVVDYERYLRFRYPQGLSFKGPSEFDGDNNRFVRPRLTVNDGRLANWSFQFATFIAF